MDTKAATDDLAHLTLRRCDIQRATPAEAAIRAARDEVEKMAADVRLTDAVVFLGHALDSVADYVDGVPRREHANAHDAELVSDARRFVAVWAAKGNENARALLTRIDAQIASAARA